MDYVYSLDRLMKAVLTSTTIILLWSKYSEILLLRPSKIKTSYPSQTLFAKFKLFFSSFSTPSVHLIRDHLWDCPKITFGQSQRWSKYGNFTVYGKYKIVN